MTWPSVTFSRRLLLLAAQLAVLSLPAAAATLNGNVQLIGSSTSSRKEKTDYEGVVLWLTSATATGVRASTKHAVMLQKGKRFVPHVLAIEAGTTVDFPNFDPIFHNAFSNFNGQIFDIGLYPPGQSRNVKFDRTGVVRVFCNIHPSMSAIILVLGSPRFAVTDHQGGYKLNNVPPGTYELHVFYEKATSEMLDSLTQRITISGDRCLPLIRISEAGYLPVAHKNKYGHDYPPGSDDATGYKIPLR